MTKVLRHIQTNAVAYVALFFAIGGGGGYAIAATSSSSRTIHACEVKKTGELLLKSRCDRVEKAVSWNEKGPAGATGAPGPAAQTPVTGYAEFDNGTTNVASNITIQPESSTGVYDITATNCAEPNFPVYSITPEVGPGSGTSSEPVAWITNHGAPVTIQVGNVSAGTFTPGGAGFELHMVCNPHS